MKYQPLYKVGDRVQYNSLVNTGAALGTVREVNNDKEPHTYAIESDIFSGDDSKLDKVSEVHIYGKV